ncbi:altered inheritance of mitochondria protein 32-like [Abrus precatorius]|uniref:Altered inheritance of mitochondria protein 32-like n=1 Tax=Abrus precatorius TaxID=3816 RepID=A0A8B8K346_ABRPR|nr:altered inheritance of mitochondria protein 32-like [Abrus precatorius]
MGSTNNPSSNFLCRRHVFLCYKNPTVWPPRIEAAEFDRLPRLLYAAINARKADIKKEICLTICEGNDGTETSNGDVLIFPDMIRYRRLTHFDVETFVEEVLVKEGEWLPGNPESLKASYVFVCSHGSRDRRCGVFGPVLVSRFREAIELHGLQGKVLISPCSHIGEHKYVGNVIIFGSSINGEVTGHLYGYVTPDDVPLLFHQHIIEGEIFDSLWRGQIGLSEDEQRKKQEQRLQLNGARNLEVGTERMMKMKNREPSTAGFRLHDNFSSCCQADQESCCLEDEENCCNNNVLVETTQMEEISANNKSSKNVNAISRINKGKGASHKFSSLSTWFDSWEQEDTYATLAVVCAAVSVAIAYSCYKQLR